MNVGIIGGGLSGICLQYYLKCDSEILEKESKIGGLCRTIDKDGFLYDIGGHILFSKDNAFVDLIKKILKCNIHFCKRNNKTLYDSKYMKYPFENGLNSLSNKEEIFNCVVDFITNNQTTFSNFEEWLYFSFGKSIAEKYLIPYNKKIWKIPLSDMNSEWVKRIPKPSIEDILKSAIGIETEGYIHQLNFCYPLYGGIESLIGSLAKSFNKVRTNFNIKSISKDGKWIISDDKEKLEFDKIVITAPINEILPKIAEVPNTVIDAGNKLKYNSLRVVMIGINNESLIDKSAIYVPDNSILAHRICFMKYFSKNNCPSGKSSLIAEITQNNMDDYLLIEQVANELHKINILNKNDIITTDVTNIKYGYPIPYIGYDDDINIIKKWTSSVGIELLGRFGTFQYINMDQVIYSSMELASRLY